MGTTGINVGAHDGPREVEPQVMAQLAAQHLRSVSIERDGTRVLLLQDGTTAVEVTAEMGSLLSAAEGFQRLADAAGDLADALHSEHRTRQQRAEAELVAENYRAWWEE